MASRKSNLAKVVKRAYWRETDARLVVESWRRSGEPVSAFARRHGVAVKRLARWVSRLGLSEQPEPVRFHPVRVTVPVEPDNGAGMEIEIELLGGCRVRVSRGFANEDLRRVLVVLEEGANC